ncbi:predicted protein [Histoplasma mississippiense (nom. inval.)]|uniref:predicted protein n=1 Tax=Ajellomyces capsulatus (strain NAm1 / WU24) TaxID=2059318 RepID=UPI000157CD90|nr:predicted protein [Histoplasma mississippiense (nom. inval.)]EDN10388.1 predicted protein [Histoplasma mississippiense (nom. inval.)]
MAEGRGFGMYIVNPRNTRVCCIAFNPPGMTPLTGNSTSLPRLATASDTVARGAPDFHVGYSSGYSRNRLRGRERCSVRLWVGGQIACSMQAALDGKLITVDKLFDYTNGNFLVNKNFQFERRYVKFDLDALCDVAAAAGVEASPIKAVEKMEGGFNKALLMKKENGMEIIAKIPCRNSGPAVYTTESELPAYCSLYLRAFSRDIPGYKLLGSDAGPSTSNFVGRSGDRSFIMDGCQEWDGSKLDPGPCDINASTISANTMAYFPRATTRLCSRIRFQKPELPDDFEWLDWRGFPGHCPYSFSQEEIDEHDSQFREYEDWHKVHELARKCLDTDEDGWIPADMDITEKRQQSQEQLNMFINQMAAEKSLEEARRMWPLVENCHFTKKSH